MKILWLAVILHRYRMFLIRKKFEKTIKKNAEEIKELKERIGRLKADIAFIPLNETLQSRNLIKNNLHIG